MGAAPLGRRVPGARTRLGCVRPEGCAAHVPGGAPEVQVNQRGTLRGLQQLADNDLQRPPAASRRRASSDAQADQGCRANDAGCGEQHGRAARQLRAHRWPLFMKGCCMLSLMSNCRNTCRPPPVGYG